MRLRPTLAAVGLASTLAAAGGQPPGRELPKDQKSLIDTVIKACRELKAVAEQVDALAATRDKTDAGVASLRKSLDESKASAEKLRVQVLEQNGRQAADRDQLRAVLSDLTAVKVKAERTAKELAELQSRPGGDQFGRPWTPDPAPWRTFVTPLADKAAAAVAERFQGASARVAVFPFGGADRKLSLRLADDPLNIQAALADRLAKVSGKRFLVLDPDDLADAVRAAGKDLQRVSAFDPTGTAARLRDLGLQAAVVGNFLPPPDDLADSRPGPVVSAALVFADGGFVHLVGADPPVSRGSWPKADQRLKVGLLVRDPAVVGGADPGWRPLPFVTTADEASDAAGALFVEVPEGAEFKVRLRNTGRPPFLFFPAGRDGDGAPDFRPNPRDTARVFGVAVQLDGVDSFLQKEDGRWRPRRVEPALAPKHVLTGPGYEYRAGIPTPQPLPTGGDGHSVYDLLGFVRGLGEQGQADRFRFGRVDQGVVAELLGTTHQIGVVTVTFYAERMPGDGSEPFAQQSYDKGPPDLAIGRGPTVAFPTQVVRTVWWPQPVLTRTIFYRRAGAAPIPGADRRVLPVAPGG